MINLIVTSVILIIIHIIIFNFFFLFLILIINTISMILIRLIASRHQHRNKQCPSSRQHPKHRDHPNQHHPIRHNNSISNDPQNRKPKPIAHLQPHFPKCFRIRKIVIIPINILIRGNLVVKVITNIPFIIIIIIPAFINIPVVIIILIIILVELLINIFLIITIPLMFITSLNHCRSSMDSIRIIFDLFVIASSLNVTIY